MKMHATFTLLGSLCLAGPFVAVTETPLEKATAAFQAGQYAQVLELAPAVGQDSGDWPKMQYLVGETQLLLGGNAEAELSFRNVLAKRPDALPAQVGLGRALTRLGKTDEAARILDAALAAAPKDVGALTAHGELLAALGKIEEAKKDLENAWKLDPKNALTVRALVEVLLRADDNPGAAAVIESFMTARPTHPLGPFLLAVVMERDGEDAQAIVHYEEALKKDPNFIDAHKNLAILCHTLSNTYRDKERTIKAYEHYERYFALGGKDPALAEMYKTLLELKDQILGS